MDGYFYHGIEPYQGCTGSLVQLMIKILNEGIIVRNQARKYNDDSMNHVCLYRKNNDYNYDEPTAFINSARGGWIDNCLVFIVNPEIDARKAIVGKETNLVDEWRCYSNIPQDKIVGIALPFEYIDEYLKEKNEQSEEDRQLLRQSLILLNKIVSQLNIQVYDSGKKNFTDEIDAKLQQSITNY